ncbi:MAG: serpin family protein [Clostridiales bacterium]|nr:serpin family protein [Clostridiales bacterium]
MKICSAKDIKAAAAIMAASILLGGCANASITGQSLVNDPAIVAEINLNEVRNTDYDQKLMDREYRRYCFDLLSQTLRDQGGDNNVMISPASIMMALDMVAAGAKGESLRQLTDLFAEGQGPLTQQAYAAAMMEKINEAEKVDFSCANAIWNNARLLGDKVNMNFVDYIRNTFLAEYNVKDFDNKTPDEINAWIDEHTNHMIKKAIDQLDPETVMVLVNAIAFEAEWQDPYMEDQIVDGLFTKADGEITEATFLNCAVTDYFETDKATGFLKSYEGGQYAFLAILPTDDSIDANEFAKDFSAEDYEKFIASVTDKYTVYTKMPEFTSDFEYLVNGTLQNLGATDVFDPVKADLSGISGAHGDIYVSKVIHKTHIEVDRKGTKAAAVTVITLEKNAVFEEDVPEVRYVECDRPFAYAIVDTETMAPIFIGTVNQV